MNMRSGGLQQGPFYLATWSFHLVSAGTSVFVPAVVSGLVDGRSAQGVLGTAVMLGGLVMAIAALVLAGHVLTLWEGFHMATTAPAQHNDGIGLLVVLSLPATIALLAAAAVFAAGGKPCRFARYWTATTVVSVTLLTAVHLLKEGSY